MKLHLAVVLVALAPLALARVPNIYDVSHSHTHVRAGNAHPKDVKATAPKIRNVVHAPVSAKKFTEIRARDILPTKKQWSPDTAFEDDDLASPEDFEKYANKGGALLCAMLGTDRTAGRLLQDARDPPSAASIWRGNLVEELKTWFWHHVPNKDCMIGWDLDHAFESLGLSSESTEYSGDNECIWVEHQEPGRGNVMMQFYEVNGKQYRATGAHYAFAVNRKGGAILCFYVTSAVSAAKSVWYHEKRDADKADLPALRALSDVLWGFWVRNNPNVKNIRYFMMIGISNDATNQLIATSSKNAGKILKEWPGMKFPTSTPEGKALLGSPNGAAFAYFLMQHKAELGYKTITDVTVTRPETDDEFNWVDATLVFHVANAPEPPPDSPQQPS